jgi:hypothetical protein
MSDEPSTVNRLVAELSRREFLERTIEFSAGLAFLGACAPFRGAAREARLPSDGLEARFRSAGAEFSLANDAIASSWSTADGAFRALRVRDVRGGRELSLSEPVFSLTLTSGALASDRLRIVRGPVAELLPARQNASRLADRFPGRQVTVVLEDEGRLLRATWRGVLRDGSAYIRQEILLEALGAPLPVREISLIDLRAPGAVVSGTVKGSPIVAGSWYMGFEHPLSVSSVEAGQARRGARWSGAADQPTHVAVVRDSGATSSRSPTSGRVSAPVHGLERRRADIRVSLGYG